MRRITNKLVLAKNETKLRSTLPKSDFFNPIRMGLQQLVAKPSGNTLIFDLWPFSPWQRMPSSHLQGRHTLDRWSNRRCNHWEAKRWEECDERRRDRPVSWSGDLIFDLWSTINFSAKGREDRSFEFDYVSRLPYWPKVMTIPIVDSLEVQKIMILNISPHPDPSWQSRTAAEPSEIPPFSRWGSRRRARLWRRWCTRARPSYGLTKIKDQRSDLAYGLPSSVCGYGKTPNLSLALQYQK